MANLLTLKNKLQDYFRRIPTPTPQLIEKGIDKVQPKGFDPFPNQDFTLNLMNGIQNQAKVPLMQRLADIQLRLQDLFKPNPYNPVHVNIPEAFNGFKQDITPYVQPIAKTIGEGLVAQGKAYSYYNPLNQWFQPQKVQQPTSGELFKAAKGNLALIGASSAPVSTIIGGIVGGGIQAGTNVLQKKPLTENVPQSVGQGIEIGAILQPLSQATSLVLKPILSKLNYQELKSITPMLKQLGNPLLTEATKQTIRANLWKQIPSTILVKAVEGGLPFGTLEALGPANTTQERLNNFKKGFISGAVFNAATQAVGYAGQYGKFKLGNKFANMNLGLSVKERPWNQKALEEAANKGDWQTVNDILDQIPQDDPYKQSMETLFRGKANTMQMMGNQNPKLGELTDIAGRSGTYKDFVKNVKQSGNFTDELANPKDTTGYSSLKDLFDTVQGKGGNYKEPPFIGILTKDGKIESYSYKTARDKADFNHSMLFKNINQFEDDTTLRFVRNDNGKVISLEGGAVIDPFGKGKGQISELAQKLIDKGADPNTPLKVEDLKMGIGNAPYQNKIIGTLGDFATKQLPVQGRFSEAGNLVQSSKLPNVGLGTKAVNTTPQPNDIQAALESGNLTKEEAQGLRDLVLNPPEVKPKSLVTRMQQSGRYPEKLRQMLEGTYNPTTDKEVIKSAKQLVFKDPVAAEARALNPQNVTDQAIGMELFNHYMDAGNVSKANQILNATAGSNEGQMIQILSQYDKTTPGGAVKFAKNIIDSYNETHPNGALSLSEKDITNIYKQADKIQSMPEGKARNIKANELLNQINDLVPSSVVDKFITVWKAGLLTSFRTHERNLIGNSLMETSEIAKDLPASFIDSMLSQATGKRTLTFTTKGFGTGWVAGGDRAKDLVMLGYDPSQDISKYDVRHVTWGKNPFEQAMKKYTSTVFNVLAAEDKPFWNSAFARSLYDQAGAEAQNAGQQGNKAFIEKLVNKPTEQMLKTATIDANYATFHDQNMLGKAATAIKQSLDKNELTKLGSEVVAPFTGVPTSITGKLFSYSPIGLVKGIGEAGQVLASQVPTLQRQASQDIGRGILGSALFALGAYLVRKGLITGNAKDLNESRQWELEGKQPNSVFINGKWRSINSVGPQTLIVLAGAKAGEELRNPEGSLGHYGGSVGKDILNQTFLAGVQGPLNAITDPYRYGKSYVGGQAASIIPNIIKDTAKAFDPYARENNTVTDYIKSGIPGLRNTLTPRRDVLGNIIPQEPTGINAYFDLFNSKAPRSTPVIDELSRLNSVGNNATPSKMTKNQTIGGVKQTLTPEQLDVLESVSGPKVQQALQQLIDTNGYQSLTDEDKAKAIDNIVSQIRKQVRAGVDITQSKQPITTQVKGKTYILVNPDTGTARMIDITAPIKQPTLVGVDVIDKKLMSGYKSAISKRENDLIDLYEAGQISNDKLIEEVLKLETIKKKTGGKKKKTATINWTPTKIKMSAFKTPTPPKISLKRRKLALGNIGNKVPALKLSKPRNTLISGIQRLA